MRHHILSAILAAFIACLGSQHVDAETVSFSDSFDGGVSSLWGNEAGAWCVSAGAYHSQAGFLGEPFPLSSLTYTGLPFELADFSVDVDIHNVLDGGIWLRSVDNRNGVLLKTGGLGAGSGETTFPAGTALYWHIFVNGQFVDANGTAVPYNRELNMVTGLFTSGLSDAHLRVEASGNTFSAFLDGSEIPVTTLTTNLFPSGRVGLNDFHEPGLAGQSFDNFMLQGVLVPEPATPPLLILGGLVVLRRR